MTAQDGKHVVGGDRLAALPLVARVERLPRAGETIGGSSFERFPGGKGANQAVAAARLGAHVKMIGAVGADPFADEALTQLRHARVELQLQSEGVTGVALILVDDRAETQIVVVPGANALVQPRSPGGASKVGPVDVDHPVIMAVPLGKNTEGH